MPREIDVAPDTSLLVDRSRSPRTTLGPKKADYGHGMDCYLLAAAVAAGRYGWFPPLKTFDWQVPSSWYESGFSLACRVVYGSEGLDPAILSPGRAAYRCLLCWRLIPERFPVRVKRWRRRGCAAKPPQLTREQQD